jgi:hypothetical protein
MTIKDALAKLLKDTEHVRNLQKEYYRTRSSSALELSKHYERELDKTIVEYKQRLQATTNVQQKLNLDQ